MPTLYANPVKFMAVTQYLWKLMAVLALLSGAIGLYLVWTAPPDYQQGTTVRILFLHVPAAWMAMMVYGFMAVASIAAFIWRSPLFDIAAQRSALIGLAWVCLALTSGSLWAKPMWGHFWAWDARLVSVLILFFLYLAYLALLSAMDNPQRARYAARIVAIVGAVNLPVIKFSVDWWNTLHQPASVFRAEGPSLAPVFLWPLGWMALFALTLTLFLLCVRMRAEILQRQIKTILFKQG